jgi:DNA invertase Pin-like site-specific DNA recombinase
MTRRRRAVAHRPVCDPARAVAYLRVSTEDQHLGPEAQRAQIAAWAAREGITVASWHTDQGVSGAKDMAERPALLEALAAMREGAAGVLVVAKRDRLARDETVAGLIDREVARMGARVLAADGAGNDATPVGEFMRTMLDGVAALERKQIAARTKAALGVKSRRGERVGTVPWGWKVGADGATLEPELRERETTERAKALRAEGLSYRDVARELAREGYTTRKGNPFTGWAAQLLCTGEPTW